MKHVLVLGAGMVARPCVQYLLKQGHRVTVVDTVRERVEHVLGGHENGIPVVGDGLKEAARLVPQADLVISLLPWVFHKDVAPFCLRENKHFINASYMNDEMKAFSKDAERQGLTFLAEMGCDPGIDHMTAVRTIREVEKRGGFVKSFSSWCGALPSLEANTNPWGYKLSWSPGDLLHACVRPSHYLRNGKEIFVPAEEVFQRSTLKEIEGVGWFEEYANANSLPYAELYGIPNTPNIYRATLRFPGWCETIRAMQMLGLFDTTSRPLAGKTLRQFTAGLCGADEKSDLIQALAAFLGMPAFAMPLKRLEWLGLFSDELLSDKIRCNRDVVFDLFSRKLGFDKDERDLLIMRHEYEVVFGAKTRRILSTLVHYGEAGGDSAIAVTTGLPPAIGADLILKGTITLRGVVAPVYPQIYEPTLAELERNGIVFEEKEMSL